ncbi:PAR12 polymerase, partial [Rhynochetos jubatus]|nr:PAR12 polymerase [Rhynochetos jubatus]
CQYYNRKDGICSQQNNCNRLHVCRHFLHGECRFSQCKRSHDLLTSHALRVLVAGGIDACIAVNIQAICDHKHVEFNKELKKGKSKPRENLTKKPAVTRSKEPRIPLQTVGSTLHVSPSESVLFIQSSPAGPSNNVPGHSQHQLPTGAGGKDEAKKDNFSAKALKDNKEEKCDEICVFYVWKYCKHKDKCRFIHYHLPYRWQIHNGITWNDLSMMEEIEKAYCDPKISSMADRNINFQTMTCYSSSVRRLSTPSSVTKPSFVLTTQWIWYWKNDRGQWIEYGEQGEGANVNSPSSDIIENLYLADPDATVSFQAGLYHYELSFKEMSQTNISTKTRRWVCRRPKFVSPEEVQKIKKGSQRDSSIPNQVCPSHWDQSALPDLGYKAVEISNTTSEYNKIKHLFLQTMRSYSVLKIWRVQNPSLWKVFQWQKEQMKRENGGREVKERLLFHGTKISFMEAICVHNFDWRICGSNGTNYGKGTYFARDASYSHTYCQPAMKISMFVARVLVGDYVKGNAAYVRPPSKSVDGLRFYDSCVDDELNPSIFVVFEKYQVYPEYIIEYKE